MSSPQMQATLYASSAVKALLSTFTVSAVVYYMIFDDALIPSDILTDSGAYSPTVKDKTINHFDVSTASPVNNRLVDRIRQISCRAYYQADAEAIRDAVFTALHRVKSSDGKAFFICSRDPVIPPTDKTDNYNAPMSVRTLNLQS
jgi:hypothetical protein